MKPEQLQRLVGNNIRYYRIQAGLTQEDLAKRAGINRSYISALERGTKNARLSTLATLVEALNLQPTQLLEQGTEQDRSQNAHSGPLMAGKRTKEITTSE